MESLQIILSVLLGMYMTLCLIHIWVAISGQARRPNLAVAFCSFIAALHVAVDLALYEASNIPAFENLLRWQIGVSITWIFSVVFFLQARTGLVRRGLGIAITISGVAAMLVNAISDASIVYASVDVLRTVEMPWGDSIRLGTGAPGPWHLLLDITLLLLFVIVLDTSFGLHRRGETRSAVLLGGVLTMLTLAGGIGGAMIDMGLLRLPYLTDFVYLGMLGIMSRELAKDIVRATRLSREVIAREMRWNTLIAQVHLLVVETDTEGVIRQVNPHFVRATGHRPADIEGQSIQANMMDAERDELWRNFELAVAGELKPVRETGLRTADGEELRVIWSSVLLRDEDGAISGLLSVGADVTARRLAELERDRAIEELSNLKQRLELENLDLNQELHGVTSEEIVGGSNALEYVMHRIGQVAGTDSSVLVLGETGVGKELVAREIHRRSRRSQKPFVRVNCAVLPPSLAESELFGHERGAFTGAGDARQGRFELADGGTLLLDEIGELPPEIQPKLLRILQEGEFERLGSSRTRRVDIRLIAATNRDLEREVAEGRFRSDLYYRLNVYPLTVPPLRDRKEDLPELVRHFVPRLARRHHKELASIPAGLMMQLESYDWPGNVRELVNVLERAVITSTGSVLKLGQVLSAEKLKAKSANSNSLQSLSDVECQHIASVLDATEGRISGPRGAAKILGIHPNTLRSRMVKLGLLGEASS